MQCKLNLKPRDSSWTKYCGYVNYFTTLSSPGVNSPDSFGKTPLHNAILGKHVRIVKLLLESGANVKCLDETGDTPLHAAVRVDSETIVMVRLPSFLKNNELV